MNRPGPIVVLDACALYPASLRNLMMWLAWNDVIRARWTEAIHEEWMRNVLANHPDLARQQLERTRRMMDEAAGECLVEGYEGLINDITLPDLDDRHVMAAAIHAQAEAVITWNLRDFPAEIVAEFGIAIQTPDEFVCGLLESSRDAVLEAMHEHRASLKNPPKSPAEYLANLAVQGLVKCSAILQGHLGRL